MLFHHVVGVFFSFSYGRKHERNSRERGFLTIGGFRDGGVSFKVNQDTQPVIALDELHGN